MDHRTSTAFTTYIQSAQHTVYEAVYRLHSLISINRLDALGTEVDAGCSDTTASALGWNNVYCSPPAFDF